MSSESIWLCSEAAQTETNNEVKLRQIFRPTSLTASEDLGGGKVGEIFVVNNDVHWKMWTLQVVLLNLECLKNCEKFFVVNVIVEFRSGKGVEMECDEMDIRICRIDRKDSSKCIVGSISLDNNLGIQHPVCKHRCRHKSLFKGCKCQLT